MVKSRSLAWVLIWVLGTLGTPLLAQEGGDEAAVATETPPEPLKFVSQHRLRSGDTDLSYRVTAEEVYIRDGEGNATASFFTISYAKTGVEQTDTRPLTFIFNGGPGSASIWLHFGLVGPRLIDIPSDASDPGVPPYRLKDNPWTLLRGDTLSPAEKEQVAEQLHRFTGLSKGYILRSDLRIYALRFIKELLREEGKSVGLLDARYAQDELDDVDDFPDGDPFSAKTGPIYVALFQSYLRNELEVDLVRRYVGTSGEANQSWKRPRNGRGAFAGYVDVTGQMAQGTKDSESLRIFSAGGYHDLTTSYFATEYMLQHSGIDPERITIENYPGGHMMYLHQPSLEALSEDIVAFIEGR